MAERPARGVRRPGAAAPAKKAPATKTVTAKAAPAKKAPAKKAPAKKAPAKAAPAEEGRGQDGPAKKAAGKKAPAKKAPAKKAPAKKAPAKKAPAKAGAAKKAPAKKAPAKKAARPRRRPPSRRPAEGAGQGRPAKKARRQEGPAKAPRPRRPGARRPGQGRAAAKARAPQGRRPRRRPRRPRSRSGALVVRADESPWTAKELAEVRAELAGEVGRLRAEITVAEHDIADLLRDSGDGAGDDQADAGTKTFEREHEMSLANNTRDMLAQAERALRAIDNGTYGICENCGNPIGKARLQVVPAGDAVHGVQAARGAPLSRRRATDAAHPSPTAHQRRRAARPGAARHGRRRGGSSIARRPQASSLSSRSCATARGPIELLGGLLTLDLTRNPGAAFGLAPGMTVSSPLIAVAVVVVIVRDRPSTCAAGLGGRARAAARRCARQPHRPDLPGARARSGVTSSTSSSCRTCRSSTSPTRRSCSAGAIVLLVAARHRLDGRVTTLSSRDRPAGPVADGVSDRAAARARRARGRARRRGAGPAVRVLPDAAPPSWSPTATVTARRRRRSASPTACTRAPGSRSSCPRRPRRVAVVAEPVPGMRVVLRRRRHRRRRQAGRRRRAPEPRLDRHRPSSAGSPPPATASRPSGAAERQGIVHRLDVGTSGLMVVAKSERAYTALKQAFRSAPSTRSTTRWCRATRTRCAARSTRPSTGTRCTTTSGRSSPDGKPSVTHYDTIEAFRAPSLLEVQLETGRTHQIRVHMSALRHPCVGDLTYGADPTLAARLGLQRQWLHAVRLAFEHPSTGQRVTFESPYPPDLAHALDVLRGPA